MVYLFGYFIGLVFGIFLFKDILIFLITIVPFTFLNKKFLIFILFTIFGIFVSNINLEPTQLLSEGDYKLEVLVNNLPDVRENKQYVTGEILSFNDCIDCLSGLKQNIKITLPLSKDISYGDKIIVNGFIERPKLIIDEDKKTIFNYPKFLLADGVLYTTSFASVHVLEKGGLSFWKIIEITKNKLLNQINKILGFPSNGLLAGLLIGAKHYLGTELLEDFRIAGLIHVVVLSGFNITIVGLFILFIFSFLPRYPKYILALICMILFGLFVGGGATVFRATAMSVIQIISILFYKPYSVLKSLFTVAIIMLSFNPLYLFYNPSFQLSFMATLGLISLSFFQNPNKKINLIKEIVITTTVAQIAVLPLLIFMMGEISVVGILVNIIVLPFISLTMLFGAISITLSFVDFVYIPFVFITDLLLKYEVFIASYFASLKYSIIYIDPGYRLFIYIFWILLIVVYLHLSKRSSATDQLIFSKKSLM